MAARDPHLRRLAARAGAATTNGAPDAAEIRAELATERLAQHIARVVGSAPALSDAQRERLAALLRPSAAGAEQPESVAS